MPLFTQLQAMMQEARRSPTGPQSLAGDIVITVDMQALVLLVGGVYSYDYVATLDGMRASGPIGKLRGIVFQILFKGVKRGNYSGKLAVSVSGPGGSVECAEPLTVRHPGNQTTQVYVTMATRQCARVGPVPGPVS